MTTAYKIDTSAPTFTITPVQPTIGAEIGNIDLSQPLDDATRDALRATLHRYKVLFFRDQDITREQQIALGRRFGDLEVHPMRPLAEAPEILRLDSDKLRDEKGELLNANWHTDTSFREIPSGEAILRAIVVPDIGGDTLWVDTAAAYNGLPAELKQRIATLKAVHSAYVGYGRHGRHDQKRLEETRQELPPQAHPIVRTHPVTGEKLLYVNSIFTSHIDGLPREEGDALLRQLLDEFKRPEYQVRLKWRANTLAFWDNRSTQHYGVYNYGAAKRVMERVTVIGERVV